MVEALDKLTIDQPVLERAPLTTVICQMRFQEVLGLSQEDVRPLQKAFAPDYPVLAREDGMEMSIGSGGLEPTGKVRRTFKFTDQEDKWKVTLTPESLALETTAYKHFKDFASRWCQVLEPTVDELEISMQDRVGLRYVNQIVFDDEPTAENLLRLVRSELVAIVGAHESRTTRLLDSLQVASFAQDDGVLALRQGVLPGDGDEKAYVLDFDYYNEERKELDLNQQVDTLKNFNHGIFELFKWAVTEETYESFGPTRPEGIDA